MKLPARIPLLFLGLLAFVSAALLFMAPTPTPTPTPIKFGGPVHLVLHCWTNADVDKFNRALQGATDDQFNIDTKKTMSDPVKPRGSLKKCQKDCTENKSSVNVTQQVSFSTTTDLGNFLKAAF